jgi:hypothetical protein
MRIRGAEGAWGGREEREAGRGADLVVGVALAGLWGRAVATPMVGVDGSEA